MRAKTLAFFMILVVVISGITVVNATRNVINSDNGSINPTGGQFGTSQQTGVVRDTNGNLFFPDYSGDSGTATQRVANLTPVVAFVSVTNVAEVSGVSTISSSAITLAVGQEVIVMVEACGNACATTIPTINTPTDNLGNTYAAIDTGNSNSFFGGTGFYTGSDFSTKVTTGGSATITATTSINSFIAMRVVVYSGVSGIGAHSITNIGITTSISKAITTTSANSMIVELLQATEGSGHNTGTCAAVPTSATSSQTIRGTCYDASITREETYDHLVTTATTYTESFSWGSNYIGAFFLIELRVSGAGLAFVTQGSASSTSSGASLTVPVSVTVGNTVIVGVAPVCGGCSSSVSDSQSNSYTSISATNGGHAQLAYTISVASSGTDTITCTFTGGPGTEVCMVVVYNGAVGVGNTGTNAGTCSGTNCQLTASLTIGARNLGISIASANAASGTLTLGASQTARVPTVTNTNGAVTDMDEASSGSPTSLSWTWSASTTNQVAVYLELKAQAGVPGQDIEDRASGPYVALLSKVVSQCTPNCGIGQAIFLGGSPVYVSSTTCTTTSGTTCAVSFSFVSGDTVLLFSTQSASTTTISSITGGGTWASCTLLTSCATDTQSGQSLRNEIWEIAAVPSTGTFTITVTFSASTNAAIAIAQYSGVTVTTCCGLNTPTGGTLGYAKVDLNPNNGFTVVGFGFGGSVSSITPTANHGLELWVSGNGGTSWTNKGDLSDLATDSNCIPTVGTNVNTPALNLHGTNMIVAQGCNNTLGTVIDVVVLSFLISYGGSTFSAATRQASANIVFTECNGCGTSNPGTLMVMSSTLAVYAGTEGFNGDMEYSIFNMATLARTDLSGSSSGNAFTHMTPTQICGTTNCIFQSVVALQPASLDFYYLCQCGSSNLDYIRFTKSGSTWSAGSTVVLSGDANGACCGYDFDQGDLYVAWVNLAATNTKVEYVNSAGVWTDISPGNNCASACMVTGGNNGVFVMVPHSNTVSYTVSFPASQGSGNSAYITQTTPANTAIRISYDCNTAQCTPGWSSTTNPMGYRDLSTSFTWSARANNPDVPGTGSSPNYGTKPSLMALQCDGTSTTSPCPSSGAGLPAFDYSMSNPPTVTINSGSTGTVTITSTKVGNGPNFSVTWSCSGLPAGFTCNAFSPTACTPTCTFTLTIGVGSSTCTSGCTQTFQVKGSPAGSGAASTVTVTVPPYDFSLSNTGAIVSRKSLTGTTSGSTTVTATLISNAGESETFSCPTNDSQITIVSCSPVCTPTCTVTITFTVSNVARGTYHFTVHASPAGATTVDTTVNVLLQNDPCFNDAGGNACVFTSCNNGTCGTSTGSLVGSLLMLFVVLLGVYVLHEKVGNAGGGPKEREYGGVSERD